jgi:hypothetical protein
LDDVEITMMRRADFRLGIRHPLIGMAVAAACLFLLWGTWDKANEVIIRQYSSDWRPWNGGDEVRVRLDADRLRAHHLSKEDVIRALAPNGIVDPNVPPAPIGVVFDTHLGTPGQYENVILKADAEGEIVRLKDVAKVESGW